MDKVSNEFPHVIGVTYLDHIGATFYSKSQIEAVQKDLVSNLYTNPHSGSVSSQQTTDAIDQVRERVLRHFKTSSDEYSVIFTSGCTAALKLLAESFNYSTQSADLSNVENGSSSSSDTHCRCSNSGVFAYTQDSHTSVIGMREIAANRGASIHYVPYDDFISANYQILNKKTIGSNNFCSSTSEYEDSQQDFDHVPENLSDSMNIGDYININALPLSEPRCDVIDFCKRKNYGLFVYPLQSNFNGQKYSPYFVDAIMKRKLEIKTGYEVKKWFIGLDAAAFVSSNWLDLNKAKPDFVTLSFYKMFGFPTGLGALIVKNSSANMLQKTDYFGGGTVLVNLATERFYVTKQLQIHERFEDGTLPFLDIISLNHGFDVLYSLGGTMEHISDHVFNLSKLVYDELSSMKHYNGNPAVKLYHVNNLFDQRSSGNVVNFNILKNDGSYLGFSTVDKLAQLYDIHLRTGCFCNMGACQYYMCLSSDDVKANYKAGHVCGDDIDLIDGKPTGSVRISFGYMSTKDDAMKFLEFIKNCFLAESLEDKENLISDDGSKVYSENVQKVLKFPPDLEYKDPTASCWLDYNGAYDNVIQIQSVQNGAKHSDDDSWCLSSIYLYPVKSCAAFQVPSWEIGSRGLLYDRRWMIVNSSGVCLSQKRSPTLCLIKPFIDLKNSILVLAMKGLPNLCLRYGDNQDGNKCNAKVCGDRVNGYHCGNVAAVWVSEALDQEGCRLVQQSNDDGRTKTDGGELSLANQSQFLLINKKSAQVLLDAAKEKNQRSIDESRNIEDLNSLLGQFRANFVITGPTAFDEERWSKLTIGSHAFQNEGRCNRCQVICINQKTAEKNKTPLITLSNINDKKNKFGIYLRHTSICENGIKCKIRVGDILRPINLVESEILNK